MNNLDEYPSIRRAALAIGFHSGVLITGIDVSAYDAQVAYFARVDAMLRKHHDAESLREYDDWLRGLTDEENETVCNGDVEEAKRLLVDSPGFIEDMLEDIFQVE